MELHKKYSTLVILFLSLMLCSCGIMKPKKIIVSQEQGDIYSKKTTQKTIPVVVALLNKARDEGKTDPAKASEILERALRIDPNNAQTYYELAKIKKEQGLFVQSRQLAAKGILLAGNDAELKNKLRNLLK